jgi:hypothetical protein
MYLLREVLSSIRHQSATKKAEWVWLWMSGGVRPQLGMSLRGHSISCFAAQSLFIQRPHADHLHSVERSSVKINRRSFQPTKNPTTAQVPFCIVHTCSLS